MVKKTMNVDKDGTVLIKEKVVNRPFKELNVRAFQEDATREYEAFIAKQKERRDRLNCIDANILSLKKEENSLKKKYNKVAARNWIYVESFKKATDPILDSLLDIEEKITKLQKERNKITGRR